MYTLQKLFLSVESSQRNKSRHFRLNSGTRSVGDNIPTRLDMSGLGERNSLASLNLNETLRTARVQAILIAFVSLHRGKLLNIYAVRGIADAVDEGCAFVEADGHLSFGSGCKGIDGVQRSPGRGVEVPSVVYLPSDKPREVGKEVAGALIENHLVNLREAVPQQFHSGGLVDTARLGSDHAVLHRIGNSKAVSPADFVRGPQRLKRSHALPVDLHCKPVLELDRHLLDLVRGVFGPAGHCWGHDSGGGREVFEILSLVGETGEVRVG
mmetsp:Transcript_9418/g.23193  ORF Transcript_9418/g.23193 Transcript_9418/m.23193 type:complete len:268 (+) Transcript_9418:332-1135(+)